MMRINESRPVTKTSCCFDVDIHQGVGSFVYPENLKHVIMDTYCVIQSVVNPSANPPAKTLYIFSNASFYRQRDQLVKENVLQVFKSSQILTHFKGRLENSFDITPDCIQMYVKEWKDDQFKICTDFSGKLIVSLYGWKKSI